MDLKERRLELGLKMSQVATGAQITESMYSLIESGKAHPSVKNAKRLAKVLGIDWTEFFKDGDDDDKVSDHPAGG